MRIDDFKYPVLCAGCNSECWSDRPSGARDYYCADCLNGKCGRCGGGLIGKPRGCPTCGTMQGGTTRVDTPRTLEYKQEEGEGLKPTNPKDAIGGDKIPFHLWPEIASILGALAMEDGALKYGRNNFRAGGVRFTIYYDAARRHWNKMNEGEWIDPDSGLPHIGHALACAAIVADAYYGGNLDYDANYPGGYVLAIADLSPHVKRLKEKYKDRNPHHWTIKDVPSTPPPPKKAEE